MTESLLGRKSSFFMLNAIIGSLANPGQILPNFASQGRQSAGKLNRLCSIYNQSVIKVPRNLSESIRNAGCLIFGFARVEYESRLTINFADKSN